MAQKRKLFYRIILRGPRGFAQLRYARTFELWYGKRRILSAAFPSNKRKVADRRTYLERKVKAVERERLKLLNLKKVKRVEKKSKIAKEDQQAFEQSFDRLDKEYPDFKNSRQEEPATLKFATIEDVTVVPIKPLNRTYRKELIEKIITRHHKTERLYLTILNFSLHEDYFIPMDMGNFNEAYYRAFSLMIAHIWDFYKETRDSTEAYILRIKYSYEKVGKKQFQDSGMSMPRSKINSQEHMNEQFRWTFKKFLGETRGMRRGKPMLTNYLSGDTLIYITGFTLEGASVDPT